MAEEKAFVEAIGEDVEAAIANGLDELGVDRSAVEIEVLEEGTRGMLGIGAKEARVRLTFQGEEAPPEQETAPVEPTEPAAGDVMDLDEAQIAKEVLEELISMLGFEDADVDVRRAKAAPGEVNPPLIASVTDGNLDPLIGRDGENLAALQLITRLIVGKEIAGRPGLVVDVNDYKVKREEKLRGLAKRLAQQAIQTQRTVVLEPMPPNERRIIHLALRDNPDVTTESIDRGKRRKVTIIPQ